MFRFTAAVSLAPALSLTVRAADWAQWLGPKRDIGSAESVEPWKEDAPPKVLWKTKVGAGFSTPVVSYGRVFVHARVSGKDREELIALEAITGKEPWKKEGMGYFHFGQVRTANGKLLILDDSGALKLVDAESGAFKERCTAKVCEGTLVAPALSDGKVYARDTAAVVCVQLAL